MLNTYAGNLPRHLYVWVDSRFTHKESMGFIPAVWFGLCSYPGRAWGCTVMLESGAVYRNLPPHGVGFRADPVKRWGIGDAQTWNCYGYGFSALEYEYLRSLDCTCTSGGRRHKGQYLFTVAPVGDGFSAYPEQSKEFMFVKLYNGRLTIQPTNHVVFEEKSFTRFDLNSIKGLKRQEEVWSSE